MIRNNKKYWVLGVPLFILLLSGIYILITIISANKKNVNNPDDYKVEFTSATVSDVTKATTFISDNNKTTTVNVNLTFHGDTVMVDFTIKNTGFFQVIINNLIINKKTSDDIIVDIVNFNNRLGTKLLVGETIAGSIYITLVSNSPISNLKNASFDVTINYTPVSI